VTADIQSKTISSSVISPHILDFSCCMLHVLHYMMGCKWLLPSNRKTNFSASISSSCVPLYGLNPLGTCLPPVGGDIGIVLNVLLACTFLLVVFFFIMVV
jgi:hypothetical protein